MISMYRWCIISAITAQPLGGCELSKFTILLHNLLQVGYIRRNKDIERGNKVLHHYMVVLPTKHQPHAMTRVVVTRFALGRARARAMRGFFLLSAS